jgi:hypothetical protein
MAHFSFGRIVTMTCSMSWSEFGAYFSTVMAVAVAVGAGLTRYFGWWD